MHVFVVVLKKFLESTLFLRVPYIARSSQQCVREMFIAKKKMKIIMFDVLHFKNTNNKKIVQNC